MQSAPIMSGASGVTLGQDSLSASACELVNTQRSTYCDTVNDQ